jgi:hypothetical protein
MIIEPHACHTPSLDNRDPSKLYSNFPPRTLYRCDDCLQWYWIHRGDYRDYWQKLRWYQWRLRRERTVGLARVAAEEAAKEYSKNKQVVDKFVIKTAS